MRHAHAARGYIALTAALGAITAVLVVAQAWLLATVVAGVASDGHDFAWVRGYLPPLVAVVAGRALVVAVQERYAHRAATTVIGQLRVATLARLVDQGPAALAGDRGPALSLLTTRGLDALDGYLTRYLPQLLLAATVTPALLVVVLTQDLLAGATIAVTLPLVPLFMALVGMATASQAQRRLATMQRLGGQVLDLVAGLTTLRAMGREQGQVERIRQAGRAYRRATMATLRSAFLSALVLESLTTLSVALVAVGVGLRLVYGQLDLRTGLLALILAPEVYLPLRQVGLHYHASVDGLAAANQAFEVLEAPVAPPGHEAAPDLRRATLELDGVAVRHAGRGRWAPAPTDLRLAPGDVVALQGSSGAGKTTLVSLVLGLRSPDRGRVHLVEPGGRTVDLDQVDRATWWDQVAWVPQRSIVVPGTLIENLTLTCPQAQPDDRDLAAALAGLDEVVAELPDGWQTSVGSGGVGLSAGQRQRLGLARGLLAVVTGRARLVVLDEPTAHLDSTTESVVLRTVEELRRRQVTVLLVAHRPALAATADRVVTVHDGADDGADGADGADDGAHLEPAGTSS